MKRTVYLRKIFLYLSVLLVCVTKYNSSTGQSVSHPYGSFCVGQTNVFTFIGQGTVNYWGVGGGGTIVSNNGNSITVVWNSAVSNTYVDAHYNGCCVASYMNINISASATASVSISASQNNICQGTSVTFTATPVNGGSTPYYYWYVGGSNVSSGTSNTYTTSSLTNGQQVYCTMSSNAPCVTNSPTSNTITMTVNTPQTMSVTISGTTSVCQGSGTSFTASVTNGVGNLTYQWQKNGTNVGSDAATPPYVLVKNTVSNGDVFTCIVTSDGCANPATSNSLTITIVTPQTFSIGPAISTITYCYGSTVNFTSNATHSAYNYQWYMNGSAVPGATSSTFTTTATSVAQLQSVTVTASTNATCVNNTTASGSAQNIPFTVNPLVTPNVSFTSPVPVILNSPSTFTATPVNGGTNPTYQWQINGTNVSGATNSSFTTTINSGAQLQTISVIMNSDATCAVNPATSSKTVEIVSSNWENMNYIRTHDVMIKGLDNWTQVDLSAIGDKIQSTTYFDGLGRPIQAVEREVNPVTNNPSAWLDVVKHFEYDAAGRSEKDFIPYPTSDYMGKYKPNAATAQPGVYTFFDNETSSSPTYSKVLFDNSPLNRILKIMMPGASWAGSNIGVTTAEDFSNSNSTNEAVRIWTLEYNSSALPASSQTYPAGKLVKTISIDENGKKVITYTDYSGLVILKKVQELTSGLTDQHTGWVCTYYVYDDLGLLRYVLTPKAVEYLNSNNWPAVTQTLIDELCFKYLYDEKGRTIVVKKPGVGEQKMVYDKKDRVVLTQHANQDKINNTALTKNQWSFVLYDDLNRTIATGLLNNDASQSTLKGYIDNGSYLLPSQTISAFVGTGNVSIVADYPVAGSSGSTNYLPGTDNTIVFNSITHYDNYNYTGVKSFNSTYSFAYTPSSSNSIEATVKSDRTNNLVTGEKIRVLDGDNNNANDVFLFSTAYYDETGAPIQSLTDNIKGGLDYEVNQYDFTGKVMSTYTSHTVASQTHTIISKNEYDKIGRFIKLSKNFNNSFYKVLSEYVYDELGRVKTKRIAPGYTGTGKTEMESLSYNYNIQGWLTGINKDYALSENNYAQWDKFFGMYFTYPNHSTLPQWNGNISSITWKSQGDNTPRKFDFEYDNLDRFKNAFYKQKNKPADGTWSNSEVDFSTYVEYEDGNGNIRSMKHMGTIPGVNNGVIVDDLRYSYLPTDILNLNGNKLKQVDDLGSLGTNNGLLGDFKDANTTQDYYYDVNGNLVKDLNKTIKNGSANGVTYNYMDKPDKIVIEGKSTIEFTYDASGEKLKKKVTYADGSVRINTYIGDFVYEEYIPVGSGGQGDQLQFILHEEGRLKIITTHTPTNAIDYELNAGSFGISNWATGKQAAFEYFIKDHLGNTRLVLTEEIQKEYYKATVERGASTASQEEPLFGKVNSDGSIPGDNELKATRYLNSGSSPWPGKTDDYTRLTASETGKDIGPNLILKVMAGDDINTNVKYYFLANNATGSGNPLTGIVNSLTGALSGGKANTLSKNQSFALNGSLSGNLPLQNFLNAHNSGTGAPKAFLNIVFFDEQFKFIDKDATTPGVGSGFVQVDFNSVNDPNANMILQKKAPKNGWVFIYLSNESNETVYFDDLNVVIDHGRISEENHYYPFGLKIGAISSKAFNKLDSKDEYQGDYSEAEEETGWNEFDLRMYDPQIGRWTSADPYDEFASPYVGMGNDPINAVDPDGGGVNFFESNGSLIGAGIGFGIGVYLALKHDNPAYALGGLLAGAGIGFAFDGGFNFSGTTNFYVHQPAEVILNDIKRDKIASALFWDLAWAKIRSITSFGKLRTVTGNNGADISNKIAGILERSKTSIGSMIIDSHAGGRDLSTVTLGQDVPENRVPLSGDLDNVSFFRNLRPYTSSLTKVYLGNCWSCTRDNATTAIRISNYWHNASVFGHAAENITTSLLFHNTFASRSWARHAYKSEYGYSESLAVGQFGMAKNNEITAVNGVVRFGPGGNIIVTDRHWLQNRVNKRIWLRNLNKAILNGTNLIHERLLIPIPPLPPIEN